MATSLALADTAEAAERIATSWLSTVELQRQGLDCLVGPFSKEEKTQIVSAIERYQKEFGLTQDALDEIILHGEKQGGFWPYLARAVPYRPVRAVYYHVRRRYEDPSRRGKWVPSEDQKLRELTKKTRVDWDHVASNLNRAASDCRDRLRELEAMERAANRKGKSLCAYVGTDLLYSRTFPGGRWSQVEEARLVEIVQRFESEGHAMDRHGTWKLASADMGHARTPRQCRNKWTDCLLPRLNNGGATPHWGDADNALLCLKIASLDLDSDEGVRWNSLIDERWNRWSGKILQRKWMALKISAYTEGATFQVVSRLTERFTRPHPYPED